MRDEWDQFPDAPGSVAEADPWDAFPDAEERPRSAQAIIADQLQATNPKGRRVGPVRWDKETDQWVEATPEMLAAEEAANRVRATPVSDSTLGRIGGSFARGANSLTGAIARPFLPEDVADNLARQQGEFEQAADAKAGGSWWEARARGVAGSLGTMGAALPAALLTGGAAAPYVLAGGAGVSQANQSLTEAKDAGLTGGKQYAYAATQGLAEGLFSAVFNKIGLPGLEGALSKPLLQSLGGKTGSAAIRNLAGQVVKKLGIAGLQEIPEEVATGITQNFATRAFGVDRERPIMSWEELGNIAAESFMAAGIANTPATIARATDVWVKRNPDVAKKVVDSRAADGSVSRKAMEEAGMKDVAKTTAAERRKLADDIQRIFDSLGAEIRQGQAVNTARTKTERRERQVAERIFSDQAAAADYAQRFPELAQRITDEQDADPATIDPDLLAVPGQEGLRAQWAQWVREAHADPATANIHAQAAENGPGKLNARWSAIPEGATPPSRPNIEIAETAQGRFMRLRSEQNQGPSTRQPINDPQSEPPNTAPNTVQAPTAKPKAGLKKRQKATSTGVVNTTPAPNAPVVPQESQGSGTTIEPSAPSGTPVSQAGGSTDTSGTVDSELANSIPADDPARLLDNAGITIKKTSKGWTVTGVPEEIVDGLKADYQGRKLGAGYFFRSDPTERLVAAAREIAAHAEQVSDSAARGVVDTRIGRLPPEAARYYEQERAERLKLARDEISERNARLDSLLAQFVDKRDRGSFKLKLLRAAEKSDLTSVRGFDEIVQYVNDHPELGLPSDESALFDMLTRERFVADDAALLEQIDADLADELSNSFAEQGDESFDFGGDSGQEGGGFSLDQEPSSAVAPQRFENVEGEQNRMFSGMDALPGQGDLFETDGTQESPDERLSQSTADTEPPITQAEVAAAFPGQVVRPIPGGYRVELENGQWFTVRRAEHPRTISREAAERSLGRKMSDEEFADFQIAGSWKVNTPDGYEADGIGIMLLVNGNATKKTVRHETLHVARSLGLISDAEWKALVNEHAKYARNEGEAEERIAAAFEAWAGPKGLWLRLKAAIKDFLARMNVLSVTADTAFRRLESGAVYSRRGNAETPRQAAERMSGGVEIQERYSLKKRDSVSQVDTPEFKRWFGDSKVVDENGEPLVVYHGTNNNKDFSVFQPHQPTDVFLLDGMEIKKANSWDYGDDASGMPEGYHYGALSDALAMGARKAYEFRKAEADRHNRISPGTSRHLADLKRMIGKNLERKTENRPTGDGSYFTTNLGYSFVRDIGNYPGGRVYPVYLKIENPVYLNASEIESAGQDWRIEKFKSQGYDGAIYAPDKNDLTKGGWSGEPQIVVFDSSQVKSAIGNSGTFDPENPDVRYSPKKPDPNRKWAESLANPGLDDPQRQKIEDDRTKMGRPTPMDFADEAAEALRRFNADYEGTKNAVDAKIRDGKRLDVVDVLAAKLIADKLAAASILNGDPEADRFIRAYTAYGTELGRELAARFDPLESPSVRRRRALMEALRQPPDRIKKQIDEARKNGDEALASSIEKKWQKKLDKMREELQELGILPKTKEELEALLMDRERLLNVVREAIARNASWNDVLFEFWNNAILSGPVTHARNVVGNAVNLAWTGLEGATRLGGEWLLGKNPDARNEARAFLAGLMPGIRQGIRNARAAWRLEAPILDEMLGKIPMSSLMEIEGRYAIGGKAGRFVRIPWRALRAADEFFKGVAVYINVGGEAYRIAKEEGHSGEALAQRIAELSADYTGEAWNRAYEASKRATFQEKGGQTRQKIKSALMAARNIPGGKYVIPFVNTPLNIAAQTALRSPLGMWYIFKKAHQNITAGRAWHHGMSPQLAQQAVGLAVAGFVFSLVGDDDDEVQLYGNHEDRGKAYTLRIGDTHLSYVGIEPVASFVGMLADQADALYNNRTVAGNVGGMLSGITEQLANKPMLEGLASVMRLAGSGIAYAGGDETRGEKVAQEAMRWAANFGASWMPNVIRQVARAAKQDVPERRHWGSSEPGQWYQRLVDRTLQRTELPLVQQAAKYDAWGRARKQNAFDNAVGDFAYRILSPVTVAKPEPHDGDKFIAKWNRERPDGTKEFAAPELSPYYTTGGKRRSMNDEQFAEAVQLAGKIADALWKNGKYDTENPTAEQVEALRADFEAARDAALDHIKGKWAGGNSKPVDPAAVAKAVRAKQIVTAGERMRTKVSIRPGENAEIFRQRVAKEKEHRTMLRERAKRWASAASA